MLGWLLARSDLVSHAAAAVLLGAAHWVAPVAAWGGLSGIVVVLAVAQWWVRGRDRARILLAAFVSLAVSFYATCWHDVSAGSARESLGPGALSAGRRAAEQAAASMLAVGALLAGALALGVLLWRALLARSLKPSAADGIVPESRSNP